MNRTQRMIPSVDKACVSLSTEGNVAKEKICKIDYTLQLSGFFQYPHRGRDSVDTFPADL